MLRSLAITALVVAVAVAVVGFVGFVGFVVIYFATLIGMLARFVWRDRDRSHDIVKTDGVATLATHWCMTHDCPATRRECLS